MNSVSIASFVLLSDGDVPDVTEAEASGFEGTVLLSH